MGREQCRLNGQAQRSLKEYNIHVERISLSLPECGRVTRAEDEWGGGIDRTLELCG